MSLQVSDPFEKILVQRDNITSGTFAFSTNVAGDYIVCFHNMGSTDADTKKTISLDLKHGVAAQDYSKLMKAEHLSPIEVKLNSYHRDLSTLRLFFL